MFYVGKYKAFLYERTLINITKVKSPKLQFENGVDQYKISYYYCFLFGNMIGHNCKPTTMCCYFIAGLLIHIQLVVTQKVLLPGQPAIFNTEYVDFTIDITDSRMAIAE